MRIGFFVRGQLHLIKILLNYFENLEINFISASTWKTTNQQHGSWVSRMSYHHGNSHQNFRETVYWSGENWCSGMKKSFFHALLAVGWRHKIVGDYTIRRDLEMNLSQGREWRHYEHFGNYVKLLHCSFSAPSETLHCHSTSVEQLATNGETDAFEELVSGGRVRQETAQVGWASSFEPIRFRTP